MKKENKPVPKTGLSGPIKTTMRDGVQLHPDIKICLSVTIPERMCRNGNKNVLCVHVCPALCRNGHRPFIIESRTVMSQPDLTPGICIKKELLPERQSLNPKICFDLMSQSIKMDPVCTFLAHLLAEDSHIELRACEKDSYIYATSTLFAGHPEKVAIHIVRNYWIPVIFRPDQNIPTP